MRTLKRVGVLIGFLMLLAVCNAQEVLLWDNDNGSTIADPETGSSVGCQVGLQNALTDLGIGFTNVSSLPTDLSGYDVIFITLGVWCLGCGSTPPGAVGTAEQARLVNFLEDGNAIYVEGVDFGSDHFNTTLFSYFGTEYVSDNAGTVTGINGAPLGFMNNLAFEYDNTGESDYLVDVLNADGGMEYQQTQSGTCCGVYNVGENDYRTIFSSVIFGSYRDGEGANTKVQLMARYFAFLAEGNVPALCTSYDEVDFQSVFIGYPQTFCLDILNMGLQPLEVSNITISGDVFSLDQTGPWTLDTGESATVQITCDPASSIEASEQLTIYSNDPDGNVVLDVMASCLEPPVIVAGPYEMNVMLPPETGNETQTITITNDGNSVLEFALDLVELNREVLILEAPITPEASLPPKGFEEHGTGMPQTRDEGGPDQFGYTWVDSNEPDGPEYIWEDITSEGTQITNWIATSSFDPMDEGYAGPFDLGFDFTYYGFTYNQVYLNSNGFIGFAAENVNMTAYSNAPIPTASTPNNIICPFWDDMDGSNGGTAYTMQDGNEFVIQFNNWAYYSGTGGITLQARIRQGGRITFLYESMTGSLDTATVGIENSLGTDGLQVVYNADYVTSGLAVELSCGPGWVEAVTSSGSLAPGESTDITLVFNSIGMELGAYDAVAQISSNDPATPMVEIPICMTVSNDDASPAIFNISLNSGESPQGAELTFTNQDGNPNHVYSAIAPANGEIIFPYIAHGTYDLEVDFDLYDDFGQNNIVIEQDYEMDIELIETLFAPINLTVDNAEGGALVRWELPWNRSLQSFNVYLDGELLQNVSETYYFWETPSAGVHTIGVTCVYTTGESDPAETEFEWQGTDPEMIPTFDSFAGIYPNPFNPSTTFRYGLAKEERVVLDIYNLRGQLVKRLDEGRVNAGWHEVTWNGTDSRNRSVGSGIFLVRMKAGKYSSVRKAVMLK